MLSRESQASTRGLLAALLAALLGLGVPIAASADTIITPRDPLPTDLVLRSVGAGQGVRGFIAPVGDTSFNPLAGYPSSKPAGFEDLNLGFAGIINASPAASPTPVIRTYCIDVRTPTRIGFGYQLGEWSAASVPQLGYIAQILNRYYPNTSQPAAAPNDNARAAAVQAAIWFFSDKYVLSSTDPVYPLTRSIVEQVLALGPIEAPEPPSLSITPPENSSGAIGSLVGPFTVSTTAPADLSVAGGEMFADSAGTVPITNPVGDGTQVWLRSTSVGTATLTARAQATVPSGNVYLYDGKTAGVTAAQKLILAQTNVITTTAQATGAFFDTGVLRVRKPVSGPGAGLQDEIVIAVVCNGVARPDFVIPAGANAGTYEATYGPIRTPATCVLTERSNGGNAAVTATSSGGVTVELPQNTTPGDEAVGTITNDYQLNPGSLVVTKTIVGAGVEARGDIVIDVVCTDGTTAQFTIPAGQPPASDYTVSPIPAGTSCTVTETANGSNTSVSSNVTISPEGPVVIPPGGSVAVGVTNTFALRPGALLITKTITGRGAANRDDIVIDVVCDNGTRQSFTIPAGQEPAAEGYLVTGLPAGTTCEVTESSTGGNSSVSVVVSGLPEQPVAIPPGGTATVQVTNDYRLRPGSLLVTKTIAGPESAVALRSAVVIEVVCSNGTEQQITIEAGQTADPAGYLIEGLPANTTCTITETADGSNAQVTAEVAISADQVTIPAGRQATSAITNTYSLNPASLLLTKNITGRDDLRGDIELLVECSDGSTLAVSIPAGTAPEPAGYLLEGIAADATCTVTETATGENEQSIVSVEGLVTDLRLRPGAQTSVTVNNQVEAKPGTLVVSKSITGGGQDLRGDVTIMIECAAAGGGDPVLAETWVIPAGQNEVEPRVYEVPADSTCTVTETINGENGQTAASTTYSVDGETADGPAEAVVPPGETATVVVNNDYTLRPGSLTVTKTIAGPGAGRQGEVVVDVRCVLEDTLKPLTIEGTLTVPAGATSSDPLVLSNLPVGAVCTVTESVDGANAAVTVTTVLPEPIEVSPGQDASAEVVNTYTSVTVIPEQPEQPGGTTPETGAQSPLVPAVLGLLLLTVGAILTRGARLQMS